MTKQTNIQTLIAAAILLATGTAHAQNTLILDDFDADNSDELLDTQGLIAIFEGPELPILAALDNFTTPNDIGAVIYQDQNAAETLVAGQWPNDQGAGVELGLDFTSLGIIGFEFDFINNGAEHPFGYTIFDGGPSGTPERKIAVWDGVVPEGKSTLSTLFTDQEWLIEAGFEFEDIGSIFYGINNNPRTAFGVQPIDNVDVELLEFRAILIPTPGAAIILAMTAPLAARRRRDANSHPSTYSAQARS